MIKGVADTHTIIWYIYGDARLSNTAKTFIHDTFEQGDQIAISAITLIEMVFLIERNRIAAESFSRLASTLGDPDSGLLELPVDLQTARALSRVGAEQIPDMPDRIIAAAALQLEVPVISRDARIIHSDLETIW